MKLVQEEDGLKNQFEKLSMVVDDRKVGEMDWKDIIDDRKVGKKDRKDMVDDRKVGEKDRKEMVVDERKVGGKEKRGWL